MTEIQKYKKLLSFLKSYDNAAIAFSGGVDSTFLLFAAREALGEKVLALTVSSPYIAQWEIAEARELTRRYSIKHLIIKAPFVDAIKNNPENRCYLCKTELFTRLKKIAKKHGIADLFDGTNSDDLKGFRPGLRALKELSVQSPLALCGLTKQNIRALSKNLNLPTWNKPPYACLLTRLPYNQPVSLDEIERIEKTEKYLINLGFGLVRVRSHGNLARIEIDKDRQAQLIQENTARKIVKKFKQLGYAYITLDISGYKTGSFDTEK